MKILVVAPQPFFTIRGTPLAIKELVSVLLKIGHSVDILTLHLGEDIYIPGLGIYRNKLLSNVIKSLSPGFSFKKLILDIVLLPKILFLILRNNYDIVHCVEESAYFAVWLKLVKPFKFVYDMDSDIPGQLVESGKIKTWFVLRFVKELERIAIKYADAVVTICPVFTNKIKKLFPNKKVFQIEDVSISDEIPETKKLEHERRILYAGNFEKYQGVEILIEGFKLIEKEFPEAVLVLAGGKMEWVDGRIIYMGKRPVSEMPEFLQSAYILVSPRIKGENTPFKIYSYLAAAKPILATNIVSHTQILTNEKDSLLVDPTVQGIADGLRRLLKDNDLAKRIGRGARAVFEQNYTRDCYEKKVKDYINFFMVKESQSTQSFCMF